MNRSIQSSFATIGCLLAMNLCWEEIHCLRAGPPRTDATAVIEQKLIHLRNEPAREWSSFPEAAENTRLERRFTADVNAQEFALRWRQQDVKQSWRVLLNGKRLGELIRDEADIVMYVPLPAGALVKGENTLQIETLSKGPQSADDIRVGELQIEPRPIAEILSEANLDIEVQDADTKLPIPARITITAARGALQMTSAMSGDRVAARPGVIYTGDGRARLGVPAGTYVIYAGRGFEYSLARMEVTLGVGQSAKHMLAIRREVPTPGFVACDTHIHTFTHSGHGDATLDERMITIAGEGIELPIATDHNAHIDFRQPAERLGVRQFFTPVIGNEVTTTVGHFNAFPIKVGGRLPDHRLKEWGPIFNEIFDTTGAKVAILNHARDVHGGTRPFGPELFNATIGENTAGWPMRFNAMEVINSGATQTAPLRLLHDWMALLNRGYQVTPVGSSDSHDVARYIVGQGRTYIRCDDRDVGKLDVNEAVGNFLQGRVAVSYGLLVNMTVNGRFQAGDLAAAEQDEVAVDLQVLGPHWTTATTLQLYSNGQLIREAAITPPSDRTRLPGVQWQGTWKLLRPPHDMHLVAIAIGKGIEGPFWATAKPYQPTAIDWQPTTLGASGAVWVDGDRDGRRSSPRDYAERMQEAAGGDLAKLTSALATYDATIAGQALHLHLIKCKSVDESQIERAIKAAAPAVTKGMLDSWKAWREQEIGRAKR